MDGIPTWIKYLIAILSLYPPFNYSSVFADISTKSGYHFDLQLSTWVKGPGYSFSDLNVV